LAAAGNVSVWAQDSQDLRPLLDRLDRLERDMNMLQRQVYAGASSDGTPKPMPPPDSAGGGATALDMDVRMGRIEDQIRTLTGQLEENSYKTEQLRQKLDKLSSDIDFRLNQLEHPGAASAGPPPSNDSNAPAGAAPANTDQPPSNPNAPVQLHPPGAGGDPSKPASKSGILGFVPAEPGGTTMLAPQTKDGASDTQAPANQQTNQQTAAAPAGLPANASPKEQYNYAFGLLRQQKYDDAAAALRAFIKANPKDDLAGSAQYWLGESYYVRKDYANAAPIFAEGYEKYPKSVKAPYDLLGLGQSLGAQGQKADSCRVFARLDRDFPQAAGDIKQQASKAKKLFGCGA